MVGIMEDPGFAADCKEDVEVRILDRPIHKIIRSGYGLICPGNRQG